MRHATSYVFVSIVLLGIGLVLAGASEAASKQEPVVNFGVPHVLDMDRLPTVALQLGAPRSSAQAAAFALMDGAGVAGVDSGAAGGPAANGFLHLEDPLVCGPACLVANTTIGDETVTAFCPPSGSANWSWHWSSGVASPGIAGCTTTAQATWFVMSNGFLGPQSPACSSTTGNCYTPGALPASGAPNAQVYGVWADLDNTCSVAPNGVYIALGGTAPNRFLVVEWWNVKVWNSGGCASAGSPQQFEIIQFESDNSVLVYYGAGASTPVASTGGEENSAGTAGLQYFRSTSIPQNVGVAYFDALAPGFLNLTSTCATPGNAGWCRSANMTARIADNNDVGPGGKVGFGVRSRNRSVDNGAETSYVNNTSFNLTLTDGVHTLYANTTDWGGNSGRANLSLRVDATPPTFQPMSDVVAEATGPDGALVVYDLPVAQDAASGPGPVTCNLPPGTRFPLGDSVVSCSASDIAGNGPATTTFRVRVVDTTPPAVDARAPIVTEATGPSGAAVTYASPASRDAVSGDGVASCSPASGSTFALGNTTVTCTATDAAGNTGTRTFTVTVRDTTPPVIEAHGDEVAEATSASGAVVTFVAPVSRDAVDGDGTTTCAPASGSMFPLGDTFVTCTGRDSRGNSASTTFRVTVRDTTPPTIDAHGNELAEATGPGGAVVNYTAPASRDAVDGVGPATCGPASGSVFPVGVTTVTCSATDARGNAAQPRTFRVTVRDTTPPTIEPHADVYAEASGTEGARVSYAAPVTRDLVDGTGVATCAPASGALFPVGETVVLCTASDEAGNIAATTRFTVRVTLQVKVTVRMDKSFYDARDAASTGVRGVVRVTAGDGTPLAGTSVQVRIVRVVAGSTQLDSVTLTDATDAAGEFRFSVPLQFALAGDYLVQATSVTSGHQGNASAAYAVGVGSTMMMSPAVQSRRG